MPAPSVKCAVARAKLVRATERAHASPPLEQAGALVRGAYLATLKTLGKITSSHAVMAGSEQFAVRPLASAMDYLIAVAKHATVSPELSVAELRQVPMQNWGALKFGAKGFREGLRTMMTVIRTRVDPDELNRDFDFHATSVGSPALQWALDQIGAMHQAAYKPWFKFARNTSLYNQALVQAIHEGLTGAERIARTNALLANPTDEMNLRALEDAAYASFQNPTAVGNAISRFKSGLRDAGTSKSLRERAPGTARAVHQTGQVLHLASNILLPFSQIPSALGGVFVDYSPLGLAKTLAEQFPKEGRSQARLATGLARVGVGTGGLFTLGYGLAKAGRLTGSYPTDKNEQAEWQAEGKQENSIKIGKHWYNLQPTEPILFPALMGANVWTARNQQPDMSTGDAVAAGGTSMVKTLAEQPYLMGLQQLTAALEDPGRAGPRLVSGLLPVPPLMGQIARGIDPQVRQTNGINQRIQAQLPFASKLLPPKLDQFGRPETRAGGLAGQLLNPATASEDRSDPVTAELDRLRAFPGQPQRALTLGKQRVALTPQQYNDELQQGGPALHRVLEQVIQSPDYQALDDDQKRVALKRIFLHVRAATTALTKQRIVNQR